MEKAADPDCSGTELAARRPNGPSLCRTSLARSPLPDRPAAVASSAVSRATGAPCASRMSCRLARSVLPATAQPAALPLQVRLLLSRGSGLCVGGGRGCGRSAWASGGPADGDVNRRVSRRRTVIKT